MFNSVMTNGESVKIQDIKQEEKLTKEENKRY